MGHRDEIEAYRAAIGRYLDLPAQHVSLFWKGRVALYAILEALGIRSGEVVVPAFTCVVVPNAILYAGARPVYAEIEPETLHVDLSKLESRLTRDTRALLAQNTFGLAPPMDELRALAQRRGLRLIEDCAHGFGGTYKGRKNGTLADASFFSTQWNKPFSTGLGGIAVTPDPALAMALRAVEASAATPSRRDAANLALLLRARRILARPETHSLAAAVYRRLGRWGLVVGSSDWGETSGTEAPSEFLKGMSSVQARAGLREIPHVDRYNSARRAVAAIYDGALAEMGVWRPSEPPYARHTFLKYPFFVRDRDRILRLAAARGISFSDWFASPIHPVRKGWEQWGYVRGSNPVAEEKSATVINLPTQPGVSARYAARVIDFLKAHRDGF